MNAIVRSGRSGTPKPKTSMFRKSRQKGAVMIVALMLLLVMTVLAVSGIGNSVLEQKMSGNYYSSASAFQAAEYGLRIAEQWMNDQMPSSGWLARFEATSNKGLYTAKNFSPSNSNEICGGDLDCYFDPTDEDQWCDGTSGCKLPKGFVTLGDAWESTTLDTLDMNLAKQPQFIIEYVGPIYDTKHVMVKGGGSTPPPPADRQAFRIIVIGWGLNGKSSHTLSSHYTLPLSET